MKIEQFATSSKASVDTLFGLAGQAFQGAEQLVALNLKTMKTLMADSQDSSYQALSVKSPAELVTLQTAAMQAAPQKALAYGKEVQAILTTMTATHRSAFEAQVAEVQAKFLETVDGAMKNAPGGDKMIALAKSAVSTANTAYEGANKAGKQVSDAMIENVTKATKAVKAKA